MSTEYNCKFIPPSSSKWIGALINNSIPPCKIIIGVSIPGTSYNLHNVKKNNLQLEQQLHDRVFREIVSEL
jgi:hypothetical protein